MSRFARLRARRAATGGSLRRYLGEEEQQLLTTRQHPIALVSAALSAFGLLLPLFIAAWGIAGIESLRGPVGDWMLRILFLIMAALVVRVAWHVLEWEFERVVITDEKVILVSGVLSRRIASTPLGKVSEFTVHQPLLGRILDFGSLVVDVPGGRDQALHGLSYLPDPTGMYRLISNMARRERPMSAGDVEDASSDARAPMPTPVQLVDIDDLAEHVRRPQPWERRLAGDDADHTIRIPRVPPADSPKKR
ncbi:MAG: PH domain-containing protein [Gaiellales bacterium]